HAYYRTARFAEAERTLRRAVELSSSVEFVAHLAAACQRTGKTDEARKLLRSAEERYRQMVQDALGAKAFRLPMGWEAQVGFLLALRETRKLVDGKDPGPDPSMAPLRARSLRRLAQLGKLDHFARLVEVSPDQPRLWIDHGRRL